MEEKDKGRGRNAREKDGTGKEGGLRVTARRPRALFILSFRLARLASTKAAFEEKSNFNIWHKRIFFSGKGEYRFLNMYWERVEWE